MKRLPKTQALTTASALIGFLSLTMTPMAAAAPDLAALAVDPNVITDSSAYIPQPPLFDPNGVTGVEQTFSHRDGSRLITDTLLMLPDPPSALAAMEADRSASVTPLMHQKTTSAPVGQNGTLSTGTSPDGSHSVTVLLFTHGSTAAQIRFQGDDHDPVPTDLVIDYGQRQDDALGQLAP